MSEKSCSFGVGEVKEKRDPGTSERKDGLREPGPVVRLTFLHPSRFCVVRMGKAELRGIFFCIWVCSLYQGRREWCGGWGPSLK